MPATGSFIVTLNSDKTNNTLCEGDSIVFTAANISTATPTTYQFLLNGIAITNNSHNNFTTDQIFDGDMIEVIASNGIDTATNSIVISVIPNVISSIDIASNQVCEGNIPDEIIVDLAGTDIGTSIKISSVKLKENVVPTISDRDFVIATVASPTVIKEPEKPVEGDAAAEGAEGEAPKESAEAAAKDGDGAKKDDKSKEGTDKKPDEKKPAEKK